MDPMEDGVSGYIPTSAFPPTLNDPTIVTINLEVAARSVGCEDGVNEELEADSFCPSNVPTF
jgi:hypothetical protein